MGHFVLKFPASKPLRHGRPYIIKKSYPGIPSAEYGTPKRETDWVLNQSGTELNFTCTVYQTVG